MDLWSKSIFKTAPPFPVAIRAQLRFYNYPPFPAKIFWNVDSY